MKYEQKAWVCMVIAAIYSSGGDYVSSILFDLFAIVFFVLTWRMKDGN